MSHSIVLARPYAKAAFEYAQEHQQLSQWSEMLSKMAAYIREPVVMQFLGDPRYNMQQHGELVLALDEQLDAASQNFIRILANNNRLALLPSITELFAQFRAAAEKTLVARVKSVVPLTDEEQSQLNTLLSKKFARTVITQYEIAPELLGGLLIQAGDHVIDSSIRGQLERMREALKVN